MKCQLIVLMSMGFVGCSSRITEAQADALSSAAAAKDRDCQAPVMTSKKAFPDRWAYEWACKPELYGDRSTLWVDVTTSGDVEAQSMTEGVSDPPPIELKVKKADAGAR